ncbi:MAG: hypothetical protein QW597_06465 [Thermoplasmataceae archaeon]
MPPMFGKSEEEKRAEAKSKIRGYQSSIGRYLRDFENLRTQSISAARKALAEKDIAAARNAARNVLRNELFIKYLKSFNLFITNLGITMEYVFMERKAHQTLTQANKDLKVNMLKDEQANQIQESIDSILDTTKDLEDRANLQLDSLDQSLSSFANQRADEVATTLENIAVGGQRKSSESPVSGGDSDAALDALLERISREGEATTK